MVKLNAEQKIELQKELQKLREDKLDTEVETLAHELKKEIFSYPKSP